MRADKKPKFHSYQESVSQICALGFVLRSFVRLACSVFPREFISAAVMKYHSFGLPFES